MGNLFGIRRRAPVVTAQDKAILQLKQQRDKIRIYQKRTEKELEKNRELALKLIQNGMKDRALVVMRRKKCMENILARTDGQLETLEGLVSDIEYTQIEVSVVEGLKVGTEALKQLNSLMNIDDIQQMMDDNEEAAAKQREITAILSQSKERYDDDELLKELDTYRTKDTSIAEQPDDKVEEKVPDSIPESTPIPQDLPVATTEQSEPAQATEENIPSTAAGLDALEQLEQLPDVPKTLVEEPQEKKIKIRQLEPAS